MDGDGLGVGDGDAVGDGEAVGDADGDSVAEGELLVSVDVPGDVIVSTAGMMAGSGPVPAEEDTPGDLDGARCVREIAGADDAGSAEVCAAAALGLDCTADEGRAVPLKAKLTATDAASTAAVTPAAVSGRHRRRHQVRFRPAGGDDASRGALAVTTTGFGEMY